MMRRSFVVAYALAWGPVATAQHPLTLVPDPICRTSPLVVTVEQTLTEQLRIPGLQIVKGSPPDAFQLQYVISVHAQGTEVAVQLDGQVLGQRGDLVASATVRSEAFEDNLAGRTESARRAAALLARDLTIRLETALASAVSSRQVMFQVSLPSAAVERRGEIADALEQGIGRRAMRPRGGTNRSLVYTIRTSAPTKTLVSQIEGVLAKFGLAVQWQIASDTTLAVMASEH